MSLPLRKRKEGRKDVLPGIKYLPQISLKKVDALCICSEHFINSYENNLLCMHKGGLGE